MVEEEETVLKVVYLRLNPIVRTLCDQIKQWKAAVGNNGNVVKILNKVTESVDILQSALLQLKEISSSPSCSATQQRYFVSAFVKVSDFVLLPLLAILRSTDSDECGCWAFLDTDSNTELIGSRVCRLQLEARWTNESATWKCVSLSSDAVRLVVGGIFQQRQQGSKTSVPTRQHFVSLSFPASKKQDFLVKCLQCSVEALPSRTSILQRRIAACSVTSAGRLDFGDDCLKNIHKTIQSLLDIIQLDDKTMQVMSEYLDGTIVIGLLDHCTAIIEPPEATKRVISVPESKDDNYDLQLDAIATIVRLIHIIERDNRTWQSVFPGLYAAMFRRILNTVKTSRSNTGSKNVAEQCSSCFVKLLHAYFQPVDRENTSTEISIHDKLESLAKLAEQTNHRSHSSDAEASFVPPGDTDPNSVFLRHCEKRVLPTLIVLINTLSVTKSREFLVQAVNLNVAVLEKVVVTSKSVWAEKAITELTHTALESLLIIGADDETNFAETANIATRQLLSMKLDSLNPSSVGNRMIELLESLSRIGHGSQDFSIERGSKLLNGYLSIADHSPGFRKPMRKIIMSDKVILRLTSMFRFAYDCKFDVDLVYKEGVLSVINSSRETSPSSSLTVTSRFLSDESQEIVSKFTSEIGHMIGSKRTCIIVDSLIADVYGEALSRMESGLSLKGHAQVQWLHRSIGIVVASKYLLQGGFMVDAVKSNQDKSIRLLLKLIGSLLPILIGEVFWDIPTTPKRFTTKKNEDQQTIVASALRGNSVFVCVLLDFIATLFELAGKESRLFLPLCLCAILEKAGSQSPITVRRVAMSNMQVLARVCGYGSPADMVVDCMESVIMGDIFGKIRNSTESSGANERVLGSSTLRHVECIITILKVASESSRLTLTPSTPGRSVLSCAEELVRELFNYFDQASVQLIEEEFTTKMFVQLFEESIDFLSVCNYGLPTRKKDKSSEVRQPWLELLQSYQCNDSDSGVSPSVGFEEHLKRKCRDVNHSDPQVPTMPSGPNLDNDVSFLSQICFRSSYLLSHPSLSVQIQCCVVLWKCFRHLGWLAERLASSNDSESESTNGPRTAVLRQIHSIWPSISARMKTLCGVTASLSDSSFGETASESTGKTAIFLSQLFDLVAAMIEYSDDFMGARFRIDVWPCLEKILRNADPCNKQNKPNLLHTRSDRDLLFCAGGCLQRVFGHKATGLTVSSIIPIAGNLCIKFIDHEDIKVASLFMGIMKAMISIDCDVLWRQLFDISGSTLQENPLFHKTQVVSNDVCAVKTKKVQAARALLDFIATLPEQTF